MCVCYTGREKHEGGMIEEKRGNENGKRKPWVEVEEENKDEKTER